MRSVLRNAFLLTAFFCLLTGFVEATYTFGLLGVDIPPEIICVLFLLAPVILLIVPRLGESAGFARLAGALATACWAASLMLGTRGRMIIMGVGTGLMLLSLASFGRRDGAPFHPAEGLPLGVLLVVALRSMSAGNLPFGAGAARWAAWALAAAGIVFLVLPPSRSRSARDRVDATAEKDQPRAGVPSTIGLCLGLVAAVVMLYFAFTSPTVLARWTGQGYTLVTIVQVGAASAFFLLRALVRGARSPRTATLLAVNALFLGALVLTLILGQPRLGAGAAYPVYAAAPTVLASIAFWAMVVLHPVLYADAAALARGLAERRRTPRAWAAGWSVAGLFILLAAFAQIFTTVYDYIPVIGPIFRNAFWLVVSLPAAIVLLAAVFLPRPAEGDARGASRLILPVVIAAAVAIVFAALPPSQGQAAPGTGALTVMTYNIQQGYGRKGEKSFAEQAAVIRSVNPDIVGLEETDSSRVAGGNGDLVRYLAAALGMESYNGPTPLAGTFGVALLSRWPITVAHTFFMPSRGEQTAAIDALVTVNGRPVHVIVTHLDNDGAMAQQELIVQAARGAFPGSVKPAAVIAMGDFNFDPKGEQYRFTTQTLADAWLAAEKRVVEPGASDPAGRIDHIFLSPGTAVLEARYLPEGPSDHPSMVAELRLP